MVESSAQVGDIGGRGARSSVVCYVCPKEVAAIVYFVRCEMRMVLSEREEKKDERRGGCSTGWMDGCASVRIATTLQGCLRLPSTPKRLPCEANVSATVAEGPTTNFLSTQSTTTTPHLAYHQSRMFSLFAHTIPRHFSLLRLLKTLRATCIQLSHQARVARHSPSSRIQKRHLRTRLEPIRIISAMAKHPKT